jgi:hypothetical protein
MPSSKGKFDFLRGFFEKMCTLSENPTHVDENTMRITLREASITRKGVYNQGSGRRLQEVTQRLGNFVV